jgi:hypothetical protein
MACSCRAWSGNLLSIRPPNARGYIHANPATGKPYVDIRKQWDKLIDIASKMLGDALVNEKADFFTFRYTGASNIAQTARNRDELMRVVNMMGDTNVETVSRHYLNLQYAPDDEVIAKWDLPNTLPAAVPQLAEFVSDHAGGVDGDRQIADHLRQVRELGPSPGVEELRVRDQEDVEPRELRPVQLRPEMYVIPSMVRRSGSSTRSAAST